ncbi:hypothetical protein [Nocardia sp. IFM 10818]
MIMGRYDASDADNAAAARAVGWPDLAGSEPQVPYGMRLRREKMREFEASALEEPTKTRWRQALLSETDAGAWINSPWQVVAIANLTVEERDALFDNTPDPEKNSQ